MTKKMLAYSIPLVPNTISWSVINASDRLVIMNFLGASANGLYSIAYKFPNLISTFYNFFNIAWRETSAKIVRDNDVKEFDKIYRMVKAAILAITIMLIAAIRYIYPFFINVQYQESIVYVPILAISIYYTSLSAFYGGVFSAYKETKILGTTSTYAAIINLVVDLALFKFIGVYAAAISTLASSLFLYLYRKYKMKKFFNAYEKNDAGILAVFVVLLGMFYLNSSALNLVAIVLALAVSLIFNMHLPYTKGNYNLPELPLNAERRRVYRRRIAVCERLMQEINSPNAEECLWDAIVAFAGYPFVTEKGLPLKYTVEGGEIFFNRKEKSVTRATVMRAFHQARTIQESEGCVSGPKKLGTFGASYLYPVFLRIGVCSKKSEIF